MFYINLYINIANGNIQQARKLKTDKSKHKYLKMAKDVLKEGIQVNRGDKVALVAALHDVEQEQKDITLSSI